MKLKMAILLFILCAFCFQQASCHSVAIVTESGYCSGKDSSPSLLECATLSRCFSRITTCILDNTTLSFEYGSRHSTTGLHGMVEIQDIADIYIQGNSSTVECHDNVGFMFRRVERLRILGLNFRNCGTTFTPRVVQSLVPSLVDFSQTFWNTMVAVIIADSYDVNLRDVAISHSRGYGLFMVNLLGNSTLLDITISYSNYAAIRHYGHNFDLCRYPENTGCSGGNVVLLYERCTECFPGPHWLEVSRMTAEYGASLELWDVNLGIEVAGGLTISPRQASQYYVAITIQDSIITSNTGKYAGNSAVTLYSTNCHITFRNTSFLSGNANVSYYADYSFSGGMYTIWGQLFDNEPFTKVLDIDNCTFSNNSGLYGGAMYMSSLVDDELTSVITSILRIHNCDIRDNNGYSSIVRVSSTRSEESSDSINYLTVIISESRLHSNGLLQPSNNMNLNAIGRYEAFSNSALYGSNQHNLSLTDITISKNRLRGLDISQSRQFFFSGTNFITGNIAENGGGIQLSQSSFLMLTDSRLYITSNLATSHGGGIYIRDDTSNTCFFQVLNITNITEPRIVLRDNSANLSGNSIFGGNVDLCQLDGVIGLDTFHDLFDIPYNRSLTEITSNIRQLCFCEASRPNCENTSKVISTFPGQAFSVFAVAVGQLNGTTVDTAVSYILYGQDSAALGDQQNAQELSTACTQLNFSLRSWENAVTTIGLQTNYDRTHLPNSILLGLEVHTRACPLGFSLDRQLMACDCNKFLLNFDVKCFINQKDNIHSPFPVWVGLDSRSSLLLAHKACPLQHCRSDPTNFTLDEADTQCQAGHSGILCGECKENLSTVFETSACKKCSNSYLSLLLVFMVAGLVLVAAMIYGDLTLSRGSFNGLILYANIIQVHQSIIFPPNHVNVVTVFIAWLNLDLGLEVCFYDGMDAYARTWLQYIFPAYVWILVIAIIFFGWHSKYAAKLFGSNAVQVLATLLLLSYTKIQRTVLETWSSTRVAHKNGSLTVWLADGNVPFMSGRHLWLSLMSIAVTTGFLVPFPFLLLCEYPLQAKFGTLMLRHKLTPLIDVYQGPFKTQFRWWTGAMLLVRGAVILVFGLNIFGDPRLNLILIVTFCAIILGTMWNFGTIYKEKFINAIETFFFVNLGLLSAWTLYNQYSFTNFFLQQIVVSYTFVGSSLVAFLAIVSAQTYLRFKRRFCRSKSQAMKRDRPLLKQTSTESETYRDSALQ